MAPQRSSSRGCEPAKKHKGELAVTFELRGWRERKLRFRSLVVPTKKLLTILRSLDSPPPAYRRRKRSGRKGKGCKEKRKEMRERAKDSVVRPGVEDVDESAVSGSCLVPGLLSDVVPGSCDTVGCLEPPTAASGGGLVTADGGGSGGKLSPKAAEFRPALARRFFNAPICRFGPPPLPPGPEPVGTLSQPHGLSILPDTDGSAEVAGGAVCTTEMEGQVDSAKVAKVAEVGADLKAGAAAAARAAAVASSAAAVAVLLVDKLVKDVEIDAVCTWSGRTAEGCLRICSKGCYRAGRSPD